MLAALVASAACRPAESNVKGFARTDAGMNAAIDSARRGVPVLLRRLQSPAAGQSYLAVKVRLGGEDRGEHIWLDSVRQDGAVLRGRLTEDAVAVDDAKAGQWVSVAPDSVSDWLVVVGGVVCGGYTMRVARERMSREERARFDRNWEPLGVARWVTENEC